ncbi:MAG: hypothetical protein J0626_11545 [Rhodospirillaceae bacterium]|nr:hypothetical protein [Rhodospirillaceae bacterium]
MLLTVIGLWSGNALWASAGAVGILLPQAIWMADFIGNAVGLPVTGMTAYMYDDALPLFTRFLSLFHFWLPLLLLYLVWRFGYDRRAICHPRRRPTIRACRSTSTTSMAWAMRRRRTGCRRICISRSCWWRCRW